MDRLEYLVRKRVGYLAIFHKIINKLSGLNKKIIKEKDILKEENEKLGDVIKEAQSEIDNGQKGIVFLDEQSKINDEQIKKIKALVEPQLPKKSK